MVKYVGFSMLRSFNHSTNEQRNKFTSITDPWDWYIYLHETHKKSAIHVGTYTMQPWILWDMDFQKLMNNMFDLKGEQK